MSVVDRNFGVTDEVRMMMTGTAFALEIRQQSGFELLVSRLAVSMLRWSAQRSQRRLTALERSVPRRDAGHHASSAADASVLVRHLRLG